MLITQAEQHIEAGKEADIVYSEKGKVSVNQYTVEEAPEKVSFNQLIVPKGKSSKLLLADGTSLHINAGTKVIYPSTFSGKTREISKSSPVVSAIATFRGRIYFLLI